ncbi:inorganic pyrophosphatase [Mycotypha africana]|uniref:inorganic pyrophosphatase n=1 Tax=Mycotypha africana TaxID=64632 RepID=UPI002301335B|nr:inorganic pyrophosphatase [Mycotypha africana]KAI8987268.1 inorganic pyrophosphatase [Mycotypha africana]
MKLLSTFTIALLINGIIAADKFTTRSVGAPNTVDYRVYFENNGQVISPFHDIPLFANEEKTIYNMVVEIPRWTNAKNEINKETSLNPIMMDVKNGRPRFVTNIFPHRGYIWNYGAFPQTWEDPNHISKCTQKKGDNDPIDVIEIGSNVATVGEVKQVKIVGIVGLIDQAETDWKVVVIDVEDTYADRINDIDDVGKYMPCYLEATNSFFTNYKLPAGDKKNSIAFKGKPQGKDFATKIVLETHEYWKALVNGTTKADKIQKINLTVKDSPFLTDPNNYTITSVPVDNPLPPAPIPKEIDHWYFLSGDKITNPVRKEARDV